MAPRANWKGFSEARPRGRSASFTAMHTSAIGPGVAICTIGLKGPGLENRVFAAIEQVMLEPGNCGPRNEKGSASLTSTSPATFPRGVAVSSAGEMESPLTSHRPDEPGCKARSATLLRSAKCASINAGFPEVHLNLRLTAMTHV